MIEGTRYRCRDATAPTVDADLHNFKRKKSEPHVVLNSNVYALGTVITK